jgi:hypothetical protein
MADNIDTTNKNRNFDASKEAGPEVNAEKAKYRVYGAVLPPECRAKS